MAIRWNRPCAGGCGKMAVSTEGWICWKCTYKEEKPELTHLKGKSTEKATFPLKPPKT